MWCVCRQTGKEDLFTNVSHPYAQRLQSVFVITCSSSVLHTFQEVRHRFPCWTGCFRRSHSRLCRNRFATRWFS
jgi:hypothetical protein